MKWLSPIDMEGIRNRESQRRTQPCGKWLLYNENFQAWLQSQSRTLWVSGSPGSGKTVLSTCIIDAVKDHIGSDMKQALAFFFCDKSDENSLSDVTILSCIIAQVLAQLDSIPDRISASYNIAARYGRSKISASDQPAAILKDLVFPLNKLYILVDGVDEFKDASTIIQTVRDLVDSTVAIQVVLLSRDTPSLRSGLDNFPNVNLTSSIVSLDVDNYLSRELARLPLGNAELQDQIFEKLSQSANGMFLWASLMIQTLKSATSTHEIMEVLSDLPIGLDTTYSSILNKLAKEPPRRRALAKRIFQWICCSARPLHWNELESALAFERSRADFVESRKPFKSAVLELGGSLIECVSGSNLFRLAHLSVREFLLSWPDDHPVHREAREFFICEELGHRELAEVCLAYQIRHDIREYFGADTEALALLEYSTLFWCHHICNASYDSDLERQVIEFLTPQIRRQIWILRLIFWQPSTFPLQYVMKLQRLLRNWISRGPNHRLHNAVTDWIQDVPSLLLSDENTPPPVGEQDQDYHNGPRLIKKLMPKISYFEKLMVIRDLSRELSMAGTLTSGEQWLTAALNSQRTLQGPSHISTVWLMNSLGIIYDQQYRVALSAQIQESALAIQTSVLGPDHLETIWTVNELGRIYRHLEKFEKAESMHQRALAVLRNVLPPRDLQIAWTLNTLARTYRKQSRFKEAITLHDEALAIQRAFLGETHPHTLWALMDKAGCYRGQGRLREAANLYRKALEGREKVLGPKHPDTLWAANDLGLVLAEMGQIDAARSLQERALSGQTEVLGREHRHTLWTEGVLDELSG
jgi:tetratricopeptide (TPR) repeat protein